QQKEPRRRGRHDELHENVDVRSESPDEQLRRARRIEDEGHYRTGPDDREHPHDHGAEPASPLLADTKEPSAEAETQRLPCEEGEEVTHEPARSVMEGPTN